MSREIGAAPGEQVMLSIRPERLRMLRPDEPADTVTEARVIDRTFLGRQVRYVVWALDRRMVVSAADTDLAVVSPYQTVRLGWNIGDLQLVAMDE